MLPFIAFTLLIIGAIVIITVINNNQSVKKLRGTLTDGFGKPPALDDDGKPESLENLDSIKRYAEYMLDFKPGDWRLDAITWNDLDMDSIFGRVNVCHSSVGEEYLYNCLHELQQDDKDLLKREKLIQYLAQHPEERVAMQMAFSKVGKENFNGLARLIFDVDDRFLKYQWVYTALAVLPIFSVLLFFVHMYVGFIVLFGSFVANIAVHHKVKNELESEMPAIDYLHLVLGCCRRLCKMQLSETLPIFDELRRCFAFFKPVMHRLPASRENTGSMMNFDFLLDYIRILFLLDVRNYNRMVSVILKQNAEFHGLFKGIGEIETAICVLNFRLSLPVHSTPVFVGEKHIKYEDLFHPLLATPVANSGELMNNSLLTGSNASGKSTFVKSLALGGVLAQTLYTCAATRFETRFTWIMTSMVMRDNIYGGDSYFIVEIKSLRRMVERVKQHPCTCYIDEILRGTNTVERIAASCAMLEWLSTQNSLCIAATHDIELTHLLAATYDNYHFREQVTTDGVMFDYKIKNGPSTTRNAIKLLDVMDFDPEIVRRAEAIAQQYD